MSEKTLEEKEKEKEKEEQPAFSMNNTIKVSEMMEQRKACQEHGCPQPPSAETSDILKAQIQNNQELYATLSRSILELHNDLRDFRKKTEGLDRVIFSLQQGINKGLTDLHGRVLVLEDQMKALNDACQTTLNKKMDEEIAEDLKTIFDEE